MGKTGIWRVGRIAFLLIFMPVVALAQAKDIWQYQSLGDEFYFKDSQTAAIVQSDGNIAILLFPDEKETFYVQVGFISKGIATSLKSTLIHANGRTHSLVISDDNLEHGEQYENGFVNYNFLLKNADVPLFQRASRWRIETSQQTVYFSLKGSRVALDQVLAARKNKKPSNYEDLQTSAISKCDLAAASPEDEKSTVATVSWSNIDANAAMKACEFAVELNPNHGRMRYQLGRAYDKANDARAFTALKVAALELRYPAAFNHLGLLYWDGAYVTQDPSNARDMFQQGMDLGNTRSKYNFARILIRDGDGENDMVSGKGILKGIADSGHGLAQLQYGRYLADGTFGTKEPVLAITYLSRAAEAGYASAAYDLAQIYRTGQGVEVNPVLYLNYLKMAARNGHIDAKEELGIE